jgi:hypothetical protein
MNQMQLFPVQKTGRYDVDLSHLELSEDEPLSSKIIDSYRSLAYQLVAQTLEDLLSEDESIRRSAVDFCLSNEHAHRQIRLLWLGWLNMEEEVLMRAAKKRLEWFSAASPAVHGGAAC